EGTTHLASCRVPVVSDLIDEEVDALLGRPFSEMKIEREDDARAPVRSPEQRAGFVLGRLLEPEIPEVKFPPQGPALDVERRIIQVAMRIVALRVPALQMVSGNQLVENRGATKVRVVRAQAVELLLLVHRVGRKRHHDLFATEEERRHLLP